MTSTLEELRAKVEALTGADEELRKDILLAVDPDYRNYDRINIGGARRILDSIEDAIALIEAALPGYEWFVNSSGFAGVRSDAYDNGANGQHEIHACALIAALLKALSTESLNV